LRLVLAPLLRVALALQGFAATEAGTAREQGDQGEGD
jgi:hypothetical protein